ncbi:hypothetical protein GUJ93_ZPchr0012g22164 [Zizania palustris]|uniref:Uncharacterized protein n=1 Tax=Zizania palustris TaxID=103762 RepID=A0A8J5WKW6_ZIZPA|nr:hypothetical protein GUJ93_ZPchr0012g22164 [Zizania palustris]
MPGGRRQHLYAPHLGGAGSLRLYGPRPSERRRLSAPREGGARPPGARRCLCAPREKRGLLPSDSRAERRAEARRSLASASPERWTGASPEHHAGMEEDEAISEK